MKNLKIQTLVIIITLSFCCFSFGNNSQSGHNISQLSNVQPIPIKGWVIWGDKTKSLWTIRKATLDLSDSTKLIITKDGDELINAGK